ncbi:MAG TPA: hypothetical protein VFX77_11495, partial [Rubrobacter sp.]|nr:hypothetical protein [Rubrobacter sp.]
MSTNLSVSNKALLVLSLIVANLLMLLWLALPARAATYTVTNINDSGPGSLRQAITDANSSTGADLIVFQSGLSGTTSKLRTSANNHKLVDITATVQV